MPSPSRSGPGTFGPGLEERAGTSPNVALKQEQMERGDDGGATLHFCTLLTKVNDQGCNFEAHAFLRSQALPRQYQAQGERAKTYALGVLGEQLARFHETSFQETVRPCHLRLQKIPLSILTT